MAPEMNGREEVNHDSPAGDEQNERLTGEGQEPHEEASEAEEIHAEAHAEARDESHDKARNEPLDGAEALSLPAQPEGGQGSLWFPEPPSKPARLLPPLALAYIGDAVYEVAVRQRVIARPNLRPHHLHRQATKFASAKAQARLLALIEPQLTEPEQDVVRQGRNAKSGTVPKNANVLDYRHATAFECLVGYLYYSGAHDRLRTLISQGFELLERDHD